jgi:antitoxin ParD1/3/4
MTMTITLSPELEKIINERVQSGEYASANEVIGEALRLLEEQEELRRIKYEALKREIAKGAEGLERGEGIPAEEVFAEVRERNKAMR